MTLSTWWHNDPLPYLTPIWGFAPEVARDDEELARLNRISTNEVRYRRAGGHRPYVARMLGEAVAFGWVATRRAEIGELGLSFVVPERDRYLWDFGTAPSWRGQGIYPRLLQSILARESDRAQRFWVVSAPENVPSALGIQRAGFLPVAELSFLRSGRPALQGYGQRDRVEAACHLLRVPVAFRKLSACWRCGPGCEGDCDCTIQPTRRRTGASALAVGAHSGDDAAAR